VVVGVASVVSRGPLQPSQARPASDPNQPDPIATALGHDRGSRGEPAAPAAPDGQPVIPLPHSGGSAAPAQPLTPDRSAVDVAGPADPTDRA
jgi:hypothetical protein